MVYVLKMEVYGGVPTNEKNPLANEWLCGFIPILMIHDNWLDILPHIQ